jgi:hypothetical protein
LASWIRIRIRIRIKIKGWIRIPIETSEDPRHCLKLAKQLYLSCILVGRIRSSAERSAAVTTQGQQPAEVFVQPELKAVFTVKEHIIHFYHLKAQSTQSCNGCFLAYIPS